MLHSHAQGESAGDPAIGSGEAEAAQLALAGSRVHAVQRPPLAAEKLKPAIQAHGQAGDVLPAEM